MDHYCPFSFVIWLFFVVIFLLKIWDLLNLFLQYSSIIVTNIMPKFCKFYYVIIYKFKRFFNELFSLEIFIIWKKLTFAYVMDIFGLKYMCKKYMLVGE